MKNHVIASGGNSARAKFSAIAETHMRKKSLIMPLLRGLRDFYKLSVAGAERRNGDLYE